MGYAELSCAFQDEADVPDVGDSHERPAAAPEEAPAAVPQGVLASGPQSADGLPDDQPPRGVQLTNIDIRQTIP